MSFPGRLLALGEAGLLLVGLLWAWLRHVSIVFQIDGSSFLQALTAAAVFCVVNIGLYHFSLWRGRPEAVHDFLAKEVFPLFRRLRPLELLALLVLVGLGEELLFRGVLQKEIGLLGASLLFGMLHGPSRSLWPLALWAAGMGVALGWLYQSTDNLFVPAAAHAIYDGAAIAYVRLASAEPAH